MLLSCWESVDIADGCCADPDINGETSPDTGRLPIGRKLGLEIKPNDGYITDSLGWVLYQQGKYQEALEKLVEADKLAPKEAVILEHLGDVYRVHSDKKQALDSYQRALENNQEENAEQRLQKKIDELRKELATTHHVPSSALTASPQL